MIKIRKLNKSFYIEKEHLQKFLADGFVEVDVKKEAEIMQKIADRKAGKVALKSESKKPKKDSKPKVATK